MAKKKAPQKPTSAKASAGKAPKKAASVKTVTAEIVEDDDGPRPAEAELGEEEDFGSDAREVAVPARKAPAGDRAVTTTDPVALYLRELRKYPLLTKEQELELAKKYYETKDPAAAQALITSNLRFVVKVAVEYSKFGARLIDLVQEGNMGLMHAVRDFNPYKGVRLITYAVWWIRGYIQEYLMKQYSLVKIGTTQNQKKLFYRLQKEKEALDALGENPNIQLISSRLGIPADEVEEMSQRIRGRDVSLNQPLDGEGSSSLMDFQKSNAESPDDVLASQEEINLLNEKVEELRPMLNEREKILLEERLLSDEPLTLQEIGEKYGITREAVRQAEARLLKKIKDLLIPPAKEGKS